MRLQTVTFLSLFVLVHQLTITVSIPRTFDCLLQFGIYQKYTGKVATTRSGKPCLYWTEKSKFSDSSFPDGSKLAAKNYCRNPDKEDFQWCYPTDGSGWEPCNIPYCTAGTECTITAKGAEYLGKLNVDKNGKKCQRWDKQTPTSHRYKTANGFNFNEKTMNETENFCRNFADVDTQIWCYTLKNDGTKDGWDYCTTPPTCQLKGICSAPPAIIAGTLVSPTGAGPFDFRTVSKYTCNAGYEFPDEYDGSECRLDKTWGTLPTCNRVKCPTLANLPFATSTPSGPADRFGTTLTYACTKGSKHTAGDLIRTCQQDKTWTGTAPTCTQIDCGPAPSESGATLELTSTTLEGGVARYKCNSNNQYYEKKCETDSKWNGTVCSGVPIGGVCPTITTATADVTTAAGCACPTFNVFADPMAIGILAALGGVMMFTVLGLTVSMWKLKHPSVDKPPNYKGKQNSFQKGKVSPLQPEKPESLYDFRYHHYY